MPAAAVAGYTYEPISGALVLQSTVNATAATAYGSHMPRSTAIIHCCCCCYYSAQGLTTNQGADRCRTVYHGR
jgi:hypothetical protein